MANRIHVKYFGSLVDVTGVSEEVLAEASDLEAVLALLQQRYPALAQRSYTLAIDKKIVQGNALLQDGQTLALMPPFSGG